jgi:hypothetical protein
MLVGSPTSRISRRRRQLLLGLGRFGCIERSWGCRLTTRSSPTRARRRRRLRRAATRRWVPTASMCFSTGAISLDALFPDELADALLSSRLFVLLTEPAYSDNQWCVYELQVLLAPLWADNGYACSSPAGRVTSCACEARHVAIGCTYSAGVRTPRTNATISRQGRSARQHRAPDPPRRRHIRCRRGPSRNPAMPSGRTATRLQGACRTTAAARSARCRRLCTR